MNENTFANELEKKLVSFFNQSYNFHKVKLYVTAKSNELIVHCNNAKIKPYIPKKYNNMKVSFCNIKENEEGDIQFNIEESFEIMYEGLYEK